MGCCILRRKRHCSTPVCHLNRVNDLKKWPDLQTCFQNSRLDLKHCPGHQSFHPHTPQKKIGLWRAKTTTWTRIMLPQRMVTRKKIMIMMMIVMMVMLFSDPLPSFQKVRRLQRVNTRKSQ